MLETYHCWWPLQEHTPHICHWELSDISSTDLSPTYFLECLFNQWLTYYWTGLIDSWWTYFWTGRLSNHWLYYFLTHADWSLFDFLSGLLVPWLTCVWQWLTQSNCPTLHHIRQHYHVIRDQLATFRNLLFSFLQDARSGQFQLKSKQKIFKNVP